MKLINYYVGVQSLLGLHDYVPGVIDATTKFKSECGPIESGGQGGYIVTFPSISGMVNEQVIKDQITAYSCQSEIRNILNNRDGPAYSVTDISVRRPLPNRWLRATILGLSMSVIGLPLAVFLWIQAWIENIDVRVSVLPIQIAHDPWKTEVATML